MSGGVCVGGGCCAQIKLKINLVEIEVEQKKSFCFASYMQLN